MKKRKVLVIIVSIVSFLCLNCNNSDNKKIIREFNYSQDHLSFRFINISKIEAENCFGADLSKNILSLDKSELSDTYILEVQNTDLDSVYLSHSFSKEYPLYLPHEVSYFKTIGDTLTSNKNFPLNFNTNLYRLAKNEKKCFLTSLDFRKGMAKLGFPYYLENHKNKMFISNIIITKQNDEIIVLPR